MQDLIEKTSKLSEGAMEEEEEWHAHKSQEPLRDAEKQEDEGAEEDMVSLENDDDGEDQRLEEEVRIARDETDSEDDADNAEFLAHDA